MVYRASRYDYVRDYTNPRGITPTILPPGPYEPTSFKEWHLKGKQHPRRLLNRELRYYRAEDENDIKYWCDDSSY